MDGTLAERLERLERANRRLGLALGLFGGMGLLGFLGLATASTRLPDVLRVQGLVVEDKAGRDRLVLEVTSRDAAAITVLDDQRKKRWNLVAAPEGTTSQSFHRPGSIPMLSLRQDPDGRSAILMGHKEGGMLMTTDPKGAGSVTLIGPNGQLLGRFAAPSEAMAAGDPGTTTR